MNKGPLDNTSSVPLNYRLISNLNFLIVTNKFNGENIRFAIDITILDACKNFAGRVPVSWFLSAEAISALAAANSEEQWKEILASYTLNMGCNVKQRSVQGAVRYCEKCECIKPDRSHHCSVCEVCTLKMDHHCPWVNNCVGFANYKVRCYVFINPTHNITRHMVPEKCLRFLSPFAVFGSWLEGEGVRYLPWLLKWKLIFDKTNNLNFFLIFKATIKKLHGGYRAQYAMEKWRREFLL